MPDAAGPKPTAGTPTGKQPQQLGNEPSEKQTLDLASTAVTLYHRVQCGKPECKRLWNNERNLAYQRKYKAEHGIYRSHSYTYERTCIHCGKVWLAKSRTAKYCSNACQATYEHGPNRKPRLSRTERRRARARRILAAAARGTRSRRTFVAGTCFYCGTTTISTRKPVSSAFCCSRRCYQLTKASARRARSRNTHIDRQSIYQRDKWNCRLCGKPVAKTKTPPHPKAPVLDHIIPIAAGGEHTPANLQLAHFLCNSIKRHLGGGEQLMLFG